MENHDLETKKSLNLIETHLLSIETLINKPKWKNAKFDNWFLRNQTEFQTSIANLKEVLERAKDNYFGSD